MDLLSYNDKLQLLSSRELDVYLLMRDMCFHHRLSFRPRQITTDYVARRLNLTYKQTRHDINKLVQLKLLERWTTCFKQQHGHTILPTKASFYRIPRDTNSH